MLLHYLVKKTNVVRWHLQYTTDDWMILLILLIHILWEINERKTNCAGTAIIGNKTEKVRCSEEIKQVGVTPNNNKCCTKESGQNTVINIALNDEKM